MLPPPQLRGFRSRRVTRHNSWGDSPPPPFLGDIIDRPREACGGFTAFRLQAFRLNFALVYLSGSLLEAGKIIHTAEKNLGIREKNEAKNG